MKIYRHSSPNTLTGDLEIMIRNTLLDYDLIKNVIFNPYLKYRDDIAIHLKNYQLKSHGFNMFGEGEGYDYIYTPLESILLDRSSPIIKKYKEEFIEDLEFMLDIKFMNNEHKTVIEDEHKYSFTTFLLEGATQNMYTRDTFFQLKFNKLLTRLEEDYKKEVLEKLAIEKIKRNKLFILGLSMKISMRDCGLNIL